MLLPAGHVISGVNEFELPYFDFLGCGLPKRYGRFHNSEPHALKPSVAPIREQIILMILNPDSSVGGDSFVNIHKAEFAQRSANQASNGWRIIPWTPDGREDRGR